MAAAVNSHHLSPQRHQDVQPPRRHCPQDAASQLLQRFDAPNKRSECPAQTVAPKVQVQSGRWLSGLLHKKLDQRPPAVLQQNPLKPACSKTQDPYANMISWLSIAVNPFTMCQCATRQE